MKAQSLIGRDLAMAAAMGALGGAAADFGGEFGDDFGDEFDGENDFAGDDFGFAGDDEFGDDDFGASRGKRSLAAAKRAMAFRRVMYRRSLINPNANSSLKVEKYAFSISENITLGTPQTFTTLSGQPDVTIRPQRLSCNAPAPMFAFIQVIRMANVNITVGAGVEDAYTYNANGVGQMLDMPTWRPANRATVLGNYSGMVPPGYIATTVVPFSVTFKGPATLVAQ